MSGWHIAGILMLLLGIIAIVVLGIFAALQARRVAVRIKSLRAHPLLDPEWRARKLAVVQRMGAAAQEARSDMPRLAAALETIALGVDGLVTGVRIIAGSVEAIFDVSVPWLRGLLT